MFDHAAFDGHERVVEAYDEASGLRAIIAIHSTRLGPAFGGCRMRPYATSAAALGDALALSKAMSYKSAICELPFGGGKAVILGDPRSDKSPALLGAMGRLVDGLGGAYVIADDVGTTLDDLKMMRTETRYTAASTPAAAADLPVTAHGVMAAMRAAVRHVLGVEGLGGVRVAVQGLGNVGGPLARLLRNAGAHLMVADLEAERVSLAVEELGAIAVRPDAIHAAAVDVFAPCALGGVLDAAHVPQIAASVVCGGANNQLARADVADLMAGHGIVYVPDYLANAGGVIDYHQEGVDDRPEAVLAAVARIGDITAGLLAEARDAGVTPLAVANARVRARLGR